MTKPQPAMRFTSSDNSIPRILYLCVRWYITYKLSYRDLVEMMAERGVVMSHTTIMRWVMWYLPEFEKRWHRFSRSTGSSWRVDKTYIAI